MKNIVRRQFLAIGVASLALACGSNGKTPTGPTHDPSPITPVPKPTVVLTFLNGSTTQPVAGAEIEFPILRIKKTTDPAGQITIEEPVSGSSLVINGGGGYILSRMIYDRREFYLWPNSGDGEYIREVAFSGLIQGAEDKLWRLNKDVSILVSEPSFVSDPSVLDALRTQAAAFTQRNGKYRYSIVTDGQALPNTLSVPLVQDASSLSQTLASGTDGVIVGAKISFRNKDAAKTRAFREFGMVLGLNETTQPSIFSRYTTVFQPTEDDFTAIRMLVNRNPLATWVKGVDGTGDKDPMFGVK